MKKKCIITSCLIVSFFIVFAQKTDTVQTVVSLAPQSNSFKTDTMAKNENSPLDIGTDRGLYILTKDGKMQLRILGSVRFSVIYDLIDMPIKKTFNTYYIPTGVDNVLIPNFYSSLNQSRLGFEVNRLVDGENVFIRLESDFNGAGGSYRIRHAYGTIGNFLIGQTWSLFSNVSSLPAMVDGDGPTGSVTLRTAQTRYSGKNNKGTRWALALEYSQPDFNLTEFDTSGFSTVQMLPDLTARIEREGILGVVQLSGVLTTISILDEDKHVDNSIGFGGSLSGTVDLKRNHKILYQLTYGKSISHFITTFSGTGNDAVFNPIAGQIDPIYSFGGFLSYGFNWTKRITTNVSVGYAELSYKETQFSGSYKNSMSISLDSFWNIVEGARIGLEYVYGQRWDYGGATGNANRLMALFYYDF